MLGLFGDMFDFNHDGELDSFERGAEFMFIKDVVMKDSDEESKFDDEDDDSDSEYCDRNEQISCARRNIKNNKEEKLLIR